MFDRYWRLRMVGALASGVAAVAFTAWYIAYVLPIDLRAGTLAFTGIVAAIDVVFVLLGIAVYQVLKAVPQRRRAALRQEAMGGNQDAMPLARSLPDTAPMPLDEPFEVLFSTAIWQWRAVVVRVVIALGSVALGIGALLQNVDVRRMGDVLMCPSGREPRCAGFLAAFMLLSSGFAIPFILIGLSTIVNALRELSVSPLRIRVRTGGLVCQTLMRGSVLIPWSEIHLLEVWHTTGKRGTAPVRYRHHMCFARTHQFEWVYAEDRTAADPLVRLTSAVMARTGLRERTFDDGMFALDSVPRFNWSERTSERVAVVLAVVALIIGMVAFLPALPPRDRSGDQTALIIIAIGLMFYLLMWFRPPRISASEQGAAALVSAASFDDAQLVIHPAVTYEMTVGSYPLFVANQVVFVIFGLMMAAFGAAFFYNEFDRSFLTNHGAPLVPVGPVSTIICIGVMAVGLAMVVAAVRARDTIVLAELGGVRKQWLLGNVFIPWERVERVERARYWGYPGYRVVSSQPKKVIGWPIEPFQPSRKPQEAGAILTTPAQMAQIIAQRSGKAVQVKKQ